MKLKWKLALSLGIILLLSIVSNLTLISLSRTRSASFAHLLEEDSETLLNVKTVQFKLTGISNDERAFLLTGDTSFTAEMKNKANQLEAYLHEFEHAEENEERLFTEQLLKAYASFQSASKRVQELYEQGDKDGALKIHFGEERTARKQLDPLVSGFIDKKQQEIEMESNEAKEDSSRMLAISSWITACSVLLGAGIIVFMVRTLIRPIRKMDAMALEIAGGNLSFEFSELKTKDEVGSLSRSFAKMTDQLRSLIQQFQENALQLASSAEQLTGASADTSESSRRINSVMKEIASGNEMQEIGSVESARAMEEITTAISRIAESSQTVSEVSSDVNAQAQKGHEAVNQTVDQMKVIHHSVSNTSEAITGLHAHSQEIHEIIQVINEIAAQTHLLALNAAIEAARAGEQGRGFAVVAAEIRKLAEHSAASTAQIQERIGLIQSDILISVEAMGRVNQEVLTGMEIAGVTANALQVIIEGVRDVTGQIHDVSAASEQISAGSEQVAASIGEMAQISRDASLKSREVSAYTEEQLTASENIAGYATALRDQSENFKTVVNRFR